MVRGGAWCSGVLGTLRRSCACGEGEIAMQPPPGWLARKFLLQQPYPVLDSWDELVCFGP